MKQITNNNRHTGPVEIIPGNPYRRRRHRKMTPRRISHMLHGKSVSDVSDILQRNNCRRDVYCVYYVASAIYNRAYHKHGVYMNYADALALAIYTDH